MGRRISLSNACYVANLPLSFSTYVQEKQEKNGNGGRPHFLNQLLKARRNPTEEVLEICNLAWRKQKPSRLIARKFHTEGFQVDRSTISRLLIEIEPYKPELIDHLEKSPRRKTFYNRELDTSDFVTVSNYIRRSRKWKRISYKDKLRSAERCFKALGGKDPRNWTSEQALEYIYTLSDASQSNMVDAIRQIAPQFRDKDSVHYIPVEEFRAKINRRFKDIFENEMKLIRDGLKHEGLEYECVILELHIALGAREGGNDNKSGISNITWDRFKKGFRFVDIYESKTKNGIWCRNCPTYLLFHDLPERLRALWKERRKPNSDKIILGGYKELTAIYKRIREALTKYYKGKVEPSILKEFSSLRPHDADKIHCNLLYEAGIRVEELIGKYIGGQEAKGLFGRVWLDPKTVTKYYLMLSERSPKIEEQRQQVIKYAERFN